MPLADSKPAHWSGTGRLRGGRGGISFFITALRVFGLRVTYALAVPPALYFSFVSPDVPATMDYHRRMFGKLPWWKRRWLVFRHFLSFGRALIDRTAILAGDTRHFSFNFEGEEHLRNAVAEGHGVLLLAAHVGNWEAAGQMLCRLGVPASIAGLDQEAAGIRSLLTQAHNANFHLLPLTGSATDVIPIVAALRRGEVVAMLGDRAYGSASARVSFLGGSAAFPIGAYIVAAIARAPLVPVFSLREPGGHYHLFGFAPQRPELPPRRRREAYLRDCAARFAAQLESVLKRDPLQWYNFYPFWDEPDGSARAQTRREADPSVTVDPGTSKPAGGRLAFRDAAAETPTLGRH
jgi:predicted LPLAT superfamily acyltransferase